jgi:hypothetical protein
MVFTLLTHLPLVLQFLALHSLVSVPLHHLAPLLSNACPNPAETSPGCTGGPDIGAGFINIADFVSRPLGAVCGGILVFEGYHYATASDDPQKAAHAKRAIWSLIIGAVIVFFGTVIGPYLQTII